MDSTYQFRVISTGKIASGFDPSVVQEKLTSVLKLKPEQARVFFDQPRVVKRQISKEAGEKLCLQLAKLGILAVTRPMEPAAPTKPVIQLAENAADLAIVEDAPPPAPATPAPEGTGSTFEPLMPVSANAKVSGVQGARDQTLSTPTRTKEPQGSLSIPGIGAAIVAALVGAWVWKFIGVTFGYELGLIAWGIGGGIGFAAAALGSRGVTSGVICALLVVVALVLGKLWTYQGFADQMQTVIAEASVEEREEMYAFYREIQEDARLYAQGSGSDAFVRQFMVDRSYTEATDPARVSAEELSAFRTYDAPGLEEMSLTNPSFEEWSQSGLGLFGEVSTLDILTDSFGLLDIVFLFLGMGTAFRLGGQVD